MPSIKIKRIYADAEKDDGFRVLVDRLWPRGLKKTEAKTDAWIKELAPSSGLRKWFDHDPEKWPQFFKAYLDELHSSEIARNFKEQIEDVPIITLLYAAKDEEHNHALVLKEFLKSLG